jgi:tRNA (guanine-N7-)-methyltransferase
VPDISDEAGAARTPGGSFFGRRKGPKLRGGQADLIGRVMPALALPETLPADLAGLFADRVRCVRLEIGFGGGEHLLAAAAAEPDVGFIGCEPFVNGMAKFLAGSARLGLRNVRVWPDDAAPLLARLPGGALDRVDLFYPDPWPKRRQRKRRFVSPATLAQIARVLRSGGAFRFATDIDDYAGWTLARVLAAAAREPRLDWTAESAADWLTPHEGWVETRYEAKAKLAGRAPTYLAMRRAAT